MKTILSLLFTSSVLAGYGQTAQPVKADSAKVPVNASPVNYDKLFAKPALSRAGLFTVKLADNKWYFEVPDSLLKRYILAVTRYKSTPAGFGSFGGEQVNEQTVYFEKNGDNKLFLRAVGYSQDVADTTQALYRAVQLSNVDPIVAVFDIKAIRPGTRNYVIDVTEFFRKENMVVSINQQEKTERKLGGLADDRTYITDMRTYPINVEVTSVKTYTTTGQTFPAAAMAGVATLELNTSLVLLPEKPMPKRLFDNRVGFFANRYVLFDENEQVAQRKYIIQRYRLEPTPEDAERYKRGELVEPARQIVYYIDPATPKKWRPYLIAGVNDWQKAFEQAGFKNAIVGKEWPEGDSTMSLEDARFSVIRYYASETPNAYGPRISDPRSGEIIESHVGWYHNVMKLVHDWYMVQVGPLDKRAQKMKFDDELMGDLIRFVSSHEIGHTLGLRHNMGASSQTPVAKLRDKKWVETNGHTVSIMDYARFNYVAQPEDNIGIAGIYPRIGAYDKWAIDWGYRLSYKDARTEQVWLNKRIEDTLAANPRLWFGGEGKDEDPRSQREDLGDDAALASEYGMKNLQRVVANLPAWTKEEGDLYSNLQTMHEAVVRQYKRYLGHVAKYVGNRRITDKSVDEKGVVYEPVTKETIKSSVAFIGKHVFNPPLWLYPSWTQSLLGIRPMNDLVEQQNYYLQIFLNDFFLTTMEQNSLNDPKAYKVTDFFDDLKAMVWDKIPADETLAYYKRALQRQYVEYIGKLVYNKDLADGARTMTVAQKSDVKLYALAHLRKLQALTATQTLQATAAVNKMHFTQLRQTIDALIEKTTK